MKRLAELSLDDLHECGVWKLSFRSKVVEANDGWVSPVRTERLDGVNLFAVRSRFEFAGGGDAIGYCVPTIGPVFPDDEAIGFLSPAIVTPEGRVTLWLGQRVSVDGRGRVKGEDPSPEELAEMYGLLKRDPDSVFPVSFRADVSVPTEFVSSGAVPGFGFMRETPDLPPKGYSKYGSETVWVT